MSVSSKTALSHPSDAGHDPRSSPSAGDVLKRNSRSFSIAAAFLPRRVRGKVQQLYAWCRAVDDAVDHAETLQDAESELNRLTNDLRRITTADVCGIESFEHPASNWIAPLILEDGVDVLHAHDLIEGMRMDLRMDAGELSIESDADVLRYSYHAAGTVALMMTQLMGVTKSVARSPAVSLGVAMQLTNIARDVREDAQRGRCYLPGVAFSSPDNALSDNALPGDARPGDARPGDARPGDARPGNVPADVVSPDSASEVIDSVRHILDLAEQRYRIAESGLRYLPLDCRRSIRVALVAYREIGREILRQDCNVISGRIVVPKLRLFLIVTHATFQGISTMITSPENTHGSETVASENSANAASSVNQCKSAVWLGISLTAFMATALFMMVYANPKSDVYSTLPLVYAAASLVLAIVTNRLSARYENEHQALAVTHN